MLVFDSLRTQFWSGSSESKVSLDFLGFPKVSWVLWMLSRGKAIVRNSIRIWKIGVSSGPSAFFI